MAVQGFNQVCRKAEDAIAGLVEALKADNLTSVTVYKGEGVAEKTVPRIVIVAPGAEPELLEDALIATGNWVVELEISLFTNFKDTDRDTRALMEGELIDMFFRNDLVSIINNDVAVEQFHAFGGAGDAGAGRGFVPDKVAHPATGRQEYQMMFTGNIYCKGSTG